MFGGRLYVVTDPNFVATIQRHYKALSFWFLEGAFTVKLGALSEHGARLLTENAAGREIGTSLVVDGMKETHTAMSAGLNSISQAAVDIIAASMDQLESEGPTDLDLWRWVDDNVALMTSGAVYGPLNPYADLKIARSLK